MLVLSRRKGQKVLILTAETEKIICTVTMNNIDGDKVSLGFEAPDDIIIHRQEVMDRIREEGINPSSHQNMYD